MVSDDQLREALATTMSGFAAMVAALEPQHWDQPTTCTGWSVADVVDHVEAGDRFTALTLSGASLVEASEAEVGLDAHSPDVVGQVTDPAVAALAAFDGSLDRIIQHRIGPVSARPMLGFRIIDQLGHTWDVVTAIGQSVALAERENLERSPNFATSPDDPGATGDLLTTFLRTIGRTG